jgi:hypothetical protein
MVQCDSNNRQCRMLEKYIEKAKAYGHKHEDIKKRCKEHGWPEEVDKVIKK